MLARPLGSARRLASLAFDSSLGHRLVKIWGWFLVGRRTRKRGSLEVIKENSNDYESGVAKIGNLGPMTEMVLYENPPKNGLSGLARKFFTSFCGSSVGGSMVTVLVPRFNGHCPAAADHATFFLLVPMGW